MNFPNGNAGNIAKTKNIINKNINRKFCVKFDFTRIHNPTKPKIAPTQTRGSSQNPKNCVTFLAVSPPACVKSTIIASKIMLNIATKRLRYL